MNGELMAKEAPRLIVHTEANPLAGTPAYMLQLAVEQGADLAKLEKLMDLQERWEANQAKKSYLAALAEFKKDPPKVIKDLVNKQYGSKYSSLANLVNTVNESLGKYGLNAAWDFDQATGIKVTCSLSHVMGHKESVCLQAPPDTSGSKNPIQQIKSTITYLQSVTFSAVTGIVAGDATADDDGNGSDPKAADIITAEQVDELRKAAKVAGKDDAYICKKARVDRLQDIQVARFQAAMNHLKKIAIGE